MNIKPCTKRTSIFIDLVIIYIGYPNIYYFPILKDTYIKNVIMESVIAAYFMIIICVEVLNLWPPLSINAGRYEESTVQDTCVDSRIQT